MLDAGVAACDGVEFDDVAGGESYHIYVSSLDFSSFGKPMTHPLKARRTPAEYPIRLRDATLPPRRRTSTTGCAGARGAFDVVVEALDYVACRCLFQVLRLEAVDVVLKVHLYNL
jgi:hypothetical protein